MQRILGAESPPRGCFAHKALLLWRTVRVQLHRTLINRQKERSESQKERCDFSLVSFKLSKMKSVLT